MITKQWYVLIEGKKEGPFTTKELKRDPRITLDTLVWKKGFADWMPIKNVPELKDLFKEPEKTKEEEETEEEQDQLKGGDLGPYQLALTAEYEPPHPIIWFILASLILLYVFYQLFQS